MVSEDGKTSTVEITTTDAGKATTEMLGYDKMRDRHPPESDLLNRRPKSAISAVLHVHFHPILSQIPCRRNRIRCNVQQVENGIHLSHKFPNTLFAGNDRRPKHVGAGIGGIDFFNHRLEINKALDALARKLRLPFERRDDLADELRQPRQRMGLAN